MRFFLTTLFALRAMAEDDKDDAIELTDATFEHDTQASTGMTTGDWFVMFHATWCGHCKAAMPDFFQLASKMKGTVNCALVDVPANPDLQVRFKVRGFPTFKFLSHGKLYDYEGARDIESFMKFLNGGYKEVKSGPIPAPTNVLTKFLQDLEGDFQEILQRRVAAAAILLCVGIFMGMLFMMCIYCCCCAISSPKVEQKKKVTNKKD